MIAPSDDFEVFAAEIVKHKTTCTHLVSTAYCGTLVCRHQETDLFPWRFIDDQRRMLPSLVDQLGTGESVDRIAISSGRQPEVERNLARKPCGNECWGIRLNFGGKAAFEIAAMCRCRTFHVACSMHPPHHTRSNNET